MKEFMCTILILFCFSILTYILYDFIKNHFSIKFNTFKYHFVLFFKHKINTTIDIPTGIEMFSMCEYTELIKIKKKNYQDNF